MQSVTEVDGGAIITTVQMQHRFRVFCRCGRWRELPIDGREELCRCGWRLSAQVVLTARPPDAQAEDSGDGAGVSELRRNVPTS